MKIEIIIEKIVTLLFLLVGIGILVKASEFKYSVFKNIGNNPATFPWLLGILLIILSVILLIGDFIKERKPEQKKAPEQKFRTAKPAIIIALVVPYTLLLPFIGYPIATVLWMFSILVLFKPKSKVVVPLIFLALIGLTYLIFWLYLPVRLPVGRIFK